MTLKNAAFRHAEKIFLKFSETKLLPEFWWRLSKSVAWVRHLGDDTISGCRRHLNIGAKTMKFAIMVYETAEDFSNRSDAAAQGEYWAAYSAYSKALKDAGVAAGGTALLPPDTATSLRSSAGKRHIQDGPFIEAKEQLGGMFLIDVSNLDIALQWAAKCPSASTGGVEVRPVLEMG